MTRIVQISLRLLICTAALVLCACSPTASLTAHKGETHAARSTPGPTESATANPSGQADPLLLSIPAIGVKASVESLGIQANGDLATPTANPWWDVGWYNAGPRPGEEGSAVIDGHLDRPGGYPAVFWSLRKVQVGDSVLVTEADGKTLLFLVTKVAFYPPQQAPLQQIFGDGGGTYLNLITCAGDWIPSQHQTTLRLVVYTTLAPGMNGSHT